MEATEKYTVVSDHSFFYELLGDTLQAYMNDDSVCEISLNADGNVWLVSVDGKSRCVGSPINADQAKTLIGVVAHHNGTEIHTERPKLSAVLPSGERFEGLLPPMVKAPAFTIRKHIALYLSLDDLTRTEVLTSTQAQQIKQAVLDKKNIIVSGETGSGKTTLANAILHEVAKTGDRIITAEDTEELKCAAKNSLALFSSEQVTMRMVMQSVMRLNPDRIVVGEVRDGVALDLIKAWCTHGGGVATLHASKAENALGRLGSLIQEAIPEIPHQQIADAVDMIVHVNYDAGRRWVNVLAVEGYSHDNREYIYCTN